MTASSEQRAVSNKGAGATHGRNVIGFTLSPLFCALCSFGGLLFSLSLPAWAQQSTKIPRIGYLQIPASPNSDRLEAFRQGLRALGYVEGKNILIERKA